MDTTNDPRVIFILLLLICCQWIPIINGKLIFLGEKLPMVNVDHNRFCVWVQSHSSKDYTYLLEDSIPRIISNGKMTSRCNIGLINANKGEALQRSQKLIFDPMKTLIFLTNDLEHLPSFFFERNIHSIFVESKNFSSYTFAAPLDRELISYNPTKMKSLKMIRFENKKIKAVTLNLAPQSILNFKTGIHRGFEYLIAAGVTSAVGLSLEVFVPRDGGWWGNEKPPGSGNYTGLLGEFVSGYADMGWANLFYSTHRTQFMTFTDWYLSDQACFLVPNPNPYPKILALVWPFDQFTWICTIISLLAFSALLFVLLQTKPYPDTFMKSSNWGMLILAVVFKQSDLTFTRIQYLGTRLIAWTFIIGMLLLGTSYAAALISFLSINVHPNPPRTLDSLNDYIINRDLDVSFCCTNMIDAIQDRQDTDVIKSRIRKDYDYSDPYRNVSKGTHVVPQSRQMLNFGIRSGLSNK